MERSESVIGSASSEIVASSALDTSNMSNLDELSGSNMLTALLHVICLAFHSKLSNVEKIKEHLILF
jgi:hypothetical protein